MLKILCLGGDKRQLEIIRELYCRRHQIDVVGYENARLPIGVIN
jgi:hypothetical protein